MFTTCTLQLYKIFKSQCNFERWTVSEYFWNRSTYQKLETNLINYELHSAN